MDRNIIESDAPEKMNRNIIVACPRCERIDINPVTHVGKCDPMAEYLRRESVEYS